VSLEKKMAEARTWIAALRDSHDNIVSIVESLGPEQLTGPSDCSDWSIAQVLSHLGSGAEIFSLMVDAGLKDGQAPGNETFPPIWDAWNAKDPASQAKDFIAADTALVERWESLDDKQLADFRIAMFGMDLDAAGLLALRLSEHAFHSWDVAVAVDPHARVSQAATNLLIDKLEQRVGRTGKPVGGPIRVLVETTHPARTFTLVVDEDVTLTTGSEPPAGGGDTMRLEIPAEAFLRLTAGRMDPDHTPEGVKAEGVSLDSVRAVFPGF
jgi:uncharacterized protein (TIGR03083 family)